MGVSWNSALKVIGVGVMGQEDGTRGHVRLIKTIILKKQINKSDVSIFGEKKNIDIKFK